MPRLLVTGGGGMVGRAVVRHPAGAGWDILAPLRDELDLRDRAAVFAYIDRHKPDAIVHAAGKVGGIQANMSDPLGYLVENGEIGSNIVLGARAAGVPRLINLGSSCMYPRNRELLVEDDILSGALEPTNEGYALAKIMVARLCRYTSEANDGLHYRTLIPPNLYGPWDKFDPERSHMLPAVIAKIHAAKAAGRDSVDIWGDGLARREFVFVDDIAGAIHWALAAAERLPDMVNIGAGHDRSINNYYESVARAVGWHGEFVHDLSKPVGMTSKLMDSDKARALGWEPQVSLDDGIAATYRWYLDSIA